MLPQNFWLVFQAKQVVKAPVTAVQKQHRHSTAAMQHSAQPSLMPRCCGLQAKQAVKVVQKAAPTKAPEPAAPLKQVRPPPAFTHFRKQRSIAVSMTTTASLRDGFQPLSGIAYSSW